ncbi:MAG: hypothetical protein LAP38_24055 [Acidobacteriia bacterium]|nr:hypothetical protein [Terriglobia bacterium]
MERGQDFTLEFLRCDGVREAARLTHHSLAQARELVERVFQLGGDLYSEVEILSDGRRVETIKNPASESRLTG